MPRRQESLVVCTPGLEGVVADELRALGLRPRAPGKGGVSVPTTDRELYLACHHLRAATRVLLRVARFRARTFDELVAGADEVAWERWLRPRTPRRWRVTCQGSRLHHTGAVAERVAAAAERAVPEVVAPPGAGAPEQPVVVRISHDEVTISVDACGEGLHRRGWRLATARAPLRPTLAAAALLGAGWDGSSPLVDPLCGSGTIAVEAALLARRLPPLAGRALALEHWPSFEPGTWASVAGAGRAAQLDAAPAPVVAADRDAGAVAATAGNAERAGVGTDVVVRHQALSALTPPDDRPGWLVTNPPWGGRVGGSGGDLRDLYAALGNLVRDRLPGWGVALVVPDATLAGHTGMALDERWRTTAGGRPVRLLVHDPD